MNDEKALNVSIKSGNFLTAEDLIKNISSLNYRDNEKSTPLYLVCCEGIKLYMSQKYELAELMLEHGADVNYLQGRAMLGAISNENIPMIKLFLEQPINIQLAHRDWLFASRNNLEITTLLIEKGANVPAPNHGILYGAISNHDYEIADYLLSTYTPCQVIEFIDYAKRALISSPHNQSIIDYVNARTLASTLDTITNDTTVTIKPKEESSIKIENSI
ncbi:MAG: ankyrin repeat domain-containing protein [Endozoicomonadaceae bacterium]|nr:ankyrin repeat domain-containing protein [Endozoicomonadaceae bacterium]